MTTSKKHRVTPFIANKEQQVVLDEFNKIKSTLSIRKQCQYLSKNANMKVGEIAVYLDVRFQQVYQAVNAAKQSLVDASQLKDYDASTLPELKGTVMKLLVVTDIDQNEQFATLFEDSAQAEQYLIDLFGVQTFDEVEKLQRVEEANCTYKLYDVQFGNDVKL